jgi:hypothetical protein
MTSMIAPDRLALAPSASRSPTWQHRLPQI